MLHENAKRKKLGQRLKHLACAFAVLCTALGWQGNSPALASDGRVMVAVQTREEFERNVEERRRKMNEQHEADLKEQRQWFETERQKMKEDSDKRFHQLLTFGAFAVVVVVVGLCVIAFIVTRALKK